MSPKYLVVVFIAVVALSISSIDAKQLQKARRAPTPVRKPAPNRKIGASPTRLHEPLVVKTLAPQQTGPAKLPVEPKKPKKVPGAGKKHLAVKPLTEQKLPAANPPTGLEEPAVANPPTRQEQPVVNPPTRQEQPAANPPTRQEQPAANLPTEEEPAQNGNKIFSLFDEPAIAKWIAPQQTRPELPVEPKKPKVSGKKKRKAEISPAGQEQPAANPPTGQQQPAANPPTGQQQPVANPPTEQKLPEAKPPTA